MVDSRHMYTLIVNQLIHDGYALIAISLSNVLKDYDIKVSSSNELERLLGLGISVSDFLSKSSVMNTSKSDVINLSELTLPLEKPAKQLSAQENIINGKESVIKNSNSITPSVINEEVLNVQVKLENDESADSLPEADTAPISDVSKLLQTPRRRLIGFEKDISELPQINDEERHFQCNICQRVYNRRDKARRHVIEIHYGIKAFQCQQCDKSFTRNDKLVRHVMNVHHHSSAFQCCHCDAKFNLCTAFKKHLQDQHDIRIGRWESQAQLVTPAGLAKYLGDAPLSSLPSDDLQSVLATRSAGIERPLANERRAWSPRMPKWVTDAAIVADSTDSADSSCNGAASKRPSTDIKPAPPQPKVSKAK